MHSFLEVPSFFTDRNATVESLLDTGTEIGDLGEKLAEEKAKFCLALPLDSAIRPDM